MNAPSSISTRSRVHAVPAALAALLLPPGLALAQDDEENPPSLAFSEVPSFGAARPGPVRPTTLARPAEEEEAEEEETEEPEVVGVAPVQFQIDKIAVDAPVEEGKIEDGVMIDPSGPWVITWYEPLSALGEGTNVVVAGHVDYWDVGAAVLYGIKDPGLVEGDLVRMLAEDGRTFEYAVEWSRLYDVATELTPEVIQEDIVGHTGEESLTIITCGGEFNYETGEYLQRQVVRATLV